MFDADFIDDDMTDGEMANICEVLLKSTFCGGDAELTEKVHSTLRSMHHNLTAPKCTICQAPEGTHYYSCSKAIKCPTCKLRIDLPPTEKHPGCKCHEIVAKRPPIYATRGIIRSSLMGKRADFTARVIPTVPKQKVPDLLSDFPPLKK
jgi:hypothetical protein